MAAMDRVRIHNGHRNDPRVPERTAPGQLEAFGTASPAEAARLAALTADERLREARAVGMYLARELTGASWPQIAREFGCSAITVFCAHRKVAREVATGGPSAAAVAELRVELAQRGIGPGVGEGS